MTVIGWIQILLYCAIVVAIVPFLGGYMTRVFNGERTILSPVLQPVEAGWKGAKTLIVAPHGPLAQIPFSLLVTRSVPQPQDRAALFSGYQELPFLLREVAVTQVPSVAALTILRGMPPANCFA